MCILQKIINSPGESVVPFSGRARWITCMVFRTFPSVLQCNIKRTQYADVQRELRRPPRRYKEALSQECGTINSLTSCLDIHSAQIDEYD